MAKFSDKQVLELFSSVLARRLQSDEESARSLEDVNYRLFLEGRMALLCDLLNLLEFYSTYEFD